MDTENTATEQEQTNGGLESNSQLDGAGETHQVSVSESSNRVNVDDTASKTEAQGTHGEGVVAMEQENGRVYSGENNSVEVLSGLLKQHKSVYRYKLWTISVNKQIPPIDAHSTILYHQHPGLFLKFSVIASGCN